MPLGVFRTTTYSNVKSSGTYRTRVAGVDRSQAVADAKLLDNFPIQKDSEPSTVIQALLTTSYPYIEFGSWYVSDKKFPELTVLAGADSNPWYTVMDMARSIGCRVYFDGLGRVVLKQITEDLNNPVETYEDDGRSVVIEISKEQDLAAIFNGVVAVGESTGIGLPVQVVVWDDNPESPTYYQGKYGSKPAWYTSSFITTEAQASDAAIAMLKELTGAPETLSWSQVVNPALEVGDVVKIVNSSTGTDATVVLDSLVIPLNPGNSMKAAARDRTVYL